jgi:hypothetical protein
MRLGTYLGTAFVNEHHELSGRLIVTQQRIDISTRGAKPDPRWSTVDSNGHFHARTAEGYPTLRSKEIPLPCDGACGGICGGEGTSRTEWSCVICREVIEPGLIDGPHYETMSGLTDWSAQLTGAGHVFLMGMVMVRFESTDPLHVTLFGAAQVGAMSASGGATGVMSAVELHGAGELGERPQGLS